MDAAATDAVRFIRTSPPMHHALPSRLLAAHLSSSTCQRTPIPRVSMLFLLCLPIASPPAVVAVRLRPTIGSPSTLCHTADFPSGPSACASHRLFSFCSSRIRRTCRIVHLTGCIRIITQRRHHPLSHTAHTHTHNAVFPPLHSFLFSCRRCCPSESSRPDLIRHCAHSSSPIFRSRPRTSQLPSLVLFILCPSDARHDQTVADAFLQTFVIMRIEPDESISEA